MKAYIDTSVLLRILFNENNPLKSFSKITLAVSCEVLRLECLRVIDRLRIESKLDADEIASIQQDLHKTCAMTEFVRITPFLLSMAGQPFPTVVRTLDAMHLAAALLWSQSKEESLIFLTHDKQLATAAQSLGFEVEGI